MTLDIIEHVFVKNLKLL